MRMGEIIRSKYLVGLFSVRAQPAKDLADVSDRSSDLACSKMIMLESSIASVENLTCILLGELKSITPLFPGFAKGDEALDLRRLRRLWRLGSESLKYGLAGQGI